MPGDDHRSPDGASPLAVAAIAVIASVVFSTEPTRLAPRIDGFLLLDLGLGGGLYDDLLVRDGRSNIRGLDQRVLRKSSIGRCYDRLALLIFPTTIDAIGESIR